MPVSTISPARFGYTGQLCLESVVTTNFLRRKHSSPQRGPRLPHNTTHAFVVHRPTAPPQLGRHTAPTVAGPLQRDPLDLVAQIDAGILRRRRVPPTVEASPAHRGERTQPLQGNQRSQAHFFLDVRVDEPRVVNACSLRCSSAYCKHRRKKSFSMAWRPTFRSSSATRLSSARILPWPVNALIPCSCNSRFQRCNTFGLTSQARATSAREAPSSSRLTAASLNSFVNCLRDMLMTLFSIQ